MYEIPLHEQPFSARQVLEHLIIPKTLTRVGLAQISCPGGRISENVATIVNSINSAKRQQVDLLVFPELCIPGYCSMDLAYEKAFLKKNRLGLQQVIEASDGIDVVVGFIDEDQERTTPGGHPWIYNSAGYIHDGRLIYIQHKELLPNYGIFNEKRYFQSGANSPRSILELENGYSIGIAICEDLWSADNHRDVVGTLKSLGANFIVSINASPYHEGQVPLRMKVLADAARTHSVGLVYTNSIGSFDAYDGELIFDGRSVVMNADGECIGAAGAFKESLSIVDLNDTKPLTLDWNDSIVDIHDALILGVRQFCDRKGIQVAYVGLSGGIDSAVVAALAVEALGPDRVIGITLPSHITSDQTKSDAFVLARNLGIRCFEHSIKGEYEAWLKQFIEVNVEEPTPLAKQNKQARIRHSILMGYTNQRPGAVLLNTSNKTEVSLGFFTLGGDSGGALAVIGDINKSLVYELAQLINRAAHSELIPFTTIEREPTPELELGQTDEKSLPAPYKELVPLVQAITEDLISREELLKEYQHEVVDATFALIGASEGKRRQLPPSIRVSKRSFGMERRIPMDHTFR
jgi:NAD+ synthase (glutamine-hydrolysing)